MVQRSGTRSAREQDDVADDDSVVGEVDKAAVLALVEELTLEEAKAEALAVSHAEDVSAWVAEIAIMQKSVPQRLTDLQQQLQMPLIEVWIAALLGGFQLEQRGEFYATEDVWIVHG